MSQWTLWLRDGAAAGPTALVSMLATEGAAPCGAGARMLVADAGTQGSLGGGALETAAIAQARAILAEPPGSWRAADVPLAHGSARLLVEHVDPAGLGWLRDVVDATPRSALVTTLGPGRIERHIAADTMPVALAPRGALPAEGSTLVERLTQRRQPLYLFGAGHVGQAVARHAAGLPFSLAWFDTREDFAGIAGVVIVPDEAIGECIAAAPAEAAVAILSHDDALDYLLAHALLSRAEPVAFAGMIGSRSKRARLFAQLDRDGFSAQALAALHCPIGIAGVGGREPDVIAISVLAQLLQLRAA